MRISDWSSDVCSSDLLSSSEETRSDRFEALILSTAPYAVRFDSANRGHLLHEQQRETVPYRLYFDGALVDLAGDNVFFYPTRTPTGVDRPRLSLVLPPVVALAGPIGRASRMDRVGQYG